MSGLTTRIPKFTEAEFERWKREIQILIDELVGNPQLAMAKYPRYKELQRDLAEAFLIEIMQEENEEMREKVQNGQMKKAKVFVDVAWDADAYGNWEKAEEVRKGIAISMLRDFMPPDFPQMTEEENHRYFKEKRDEIVQAIARARRRTRYSGP